MSSGYIKLNRCADLENMIVRRPNAFMLLTLIAIRARWSEDSCKITGLTQGQAYIGDYRSCGLTRQQHRTALNWLKANQYVTTKSTTKGTTATLCDSSVYDVFKGGKQPTTNQQTTNEQPTSNQQATTKKKVKTVKTDKKEKKIEDEKPFIPPSEEEIQDQLKLILKSKGLRVTPTRGLAYSERYLISRTEAEWIKANGKKVKNWKLDLRTWIGYAITNGEIAKTNEGKRK
tara:strand:- start:1757 stop:2449 length:693 start_codon:yes stop_codon:yes gene_type:complete